MLDSVVGPLHISHDALAERLFLLKARLILQDEKGEAYQKVFQQKSWPCRLGVDSPCEVGCLLKERGVSSSHHASVNHHVTPLQASKHHILSQCYGSMPAC